MRAIFLRRDEDADRWFWILIAVVVLAISHLLAAYLGGWYVMDEAKAAAAKIVRETPRRANPATYIPLLDCTSRDYLEYRRVCRARARSAEVGGGK